ncbi:TonB-dependent receptor [Flavobacterium gawalongense]|uniref:TonB-dependent receptor n=1 Tax=Flavobacterium gawalongense TaxID=2594432 RepID=A0A553BWT6_9FLAO|nr:TonB-dependent receptor [Flavobacterium gawalongense]TRX04144.1 TonB-dependent receptor [Flavobacterium gawalongense]TRX09406.1 TonB-dependent receptor [Flavobacterium gawalongense]TRX12780.1 TonB-dependent receptor [Flavobacterium gawalongense]TRX13125.1 TonB-dependent receptor [Flavobacterium gawalongense]TRX30813.1 TonB-dependent receptor [Flavobacterium gawalongense]
MNTISVSKSQSSKVSNFKNLTYYMSFVFLLASFISFSQVKDTTKVNLLDEVLVSAVRVTSKTPVSFSNLDKKEIKFRNLGQDIPILMNYLPSVVTTSDAGNGVGYTGIRVRGSDATRVNVTINGIPYNDSESHGTYWVDMPDFASSVESLQLQRGVGTSTNGAGAFGASLNMLTDSYAKESNGEISNSFGSFNTRKHTVKFSTGLINDHFELAGRLSALKSDGYIDRASSDLKSYFLQGTYVGKTTLIKALAFGGKEKTYQSWNGIDEATLNSDRTFNSAGIFTDEFGNTRYYDNETDNYQQDHYQLHWNEKVSKNWDTNLAFHYTKGKGYYENYKEDADFADYGLQPVGAITTTDLIRQKWLDNDFYGTTFSANYADEKLDVIFGGGYNKYEGDHFGKVIWARYASQSELGDHYYDDFASKTDGNVFAKANYQITEKLSLFGDLQLRNVHYKANSPETGFVNDTFNFFNPKAGLNFDINAKSKLYFSYARANREPNRTDYENGSPRPEKLDDFELGLRHASAKVKWNANIYYMGYKDQLILTGELDDVGSPIRKNSGDSYRLGLEIDATIAVLDNLIIRPNVTISTNKNKDFYFKRDGVLSSLGDTNIAYSPNFIAGNIVTFMPINNLQVSLLSKIVGDQYMGNIDSEASKLKAYYVNDINVSYEFKPKAIFKSVLLSGLVNNIFDYKYVSNGYFYTYDDDDYSNPPAITTIEGAGYYPQAGINFLVGLTLKF